MFKILNPNKNCPILTDRAGEQLEKNETHVCGSRFSSSPLTCNGFMPESWTGWGVYVTTL
ncbi:MAG TPA: hypothetical protein H9818_09780 [Candidatus Phocaeicola gallistercoris]|nr:hypothetical protein [Candidatus Phocaeicola gallistercoris]